MEHIPFPTDEDDPNNLMQRDAYAEFYRDIMETWAHHIERMGLYFHTENVIRWLMFNRTQFIWNYLRNPQDIIQRRQRGEGRTNNNYVMTRMWIDDPNLDHHLYRTEDDFAELRDYLTQEP